MQADKSCCIANQSKLLKPINAYAVQLSITMSEQIYEVEEIIEHRVKSGRYEYKIKWKGYGLGDCTWQPEPNLSDCPDLLKKYKIRKGIIKGQKNIGITHKTNKRNSDQEEEYSEERNENQEDEQNMQIDIARGRGRGRGQSRIKRVRQTARRDTPIQITQQQPQNNVDQIQEEQNQYQQVKPDIVKMLKNQKENIFYKCRNGNVISTIPRSQMVKTDLITLLTFYERHLKIRQAIN